MHPVATLLQIVVLFGTTLAIIFIDRSVRKNKPVPQDTFPKPEPSVGMLLLLTFLCNIAALPLYFFQTRNKPLWGFIGFVGFCFCFGVSVVAGIIANVVLTIMG
jgi:hypothetical protein